MVTIVNILKENNQPNKKPDANCRAGGTGVADEALAILIFGRYVNPIPIRWAESITFRTPQFFRHSASTELFTYSYVI